MKNQEDNCGSSHKMIEGKNGKEFVDYFFLGEKH
jgi:hypothetical protein